MGLDFSIILYLALAVHLMIGLVVGTLCFLLGGFVLRKIVDRVRSPERTRARAKRGGVSEQADRLDCSRQPGIA